MCVNSSSSSDLPLFQNLTPSISSAVSLYLQCATSEPGFLIFITFNILNIFLLLPLCIFILHNGLQHYHRKRSSSSAAVLSHSDCFTFHLVMMELVGVFGCILSCCHFDTQHFDVLTLSMILYSLTWYGEIFFHTLTCAERYLAVVHPITYLSLKSEWWIRIRDISMACVWLLCIIALVLYHTGSEGIVDFILLILSAAVISFCSVSVLCALIRPGPGEQITSRGRVDQSKRRAFYTVMAILGAQVLKFAWSLCCSVMYLIREYSRVTCVMLMCENMFSLPASLVLPLLFLIRAGRFECCKN